LENENTFLNNEIKRLNSLGIRFPETGEDSQKEWPKKTPIGDVDKIVVSAFEAEVDLPKPSGEFRPLAENQEALVEAARRRKSSIYGLLPKLRFMARATELAFFKFGKNGGDQEKMPTWIQNATWERDFKQKGKRTLWNRLILTQPGVGEFGIALRYRIWAKTETVARDARDF